MQGRIQDFLKGGGSILGLQAKRGGGKRGSNFGPNVKKPTSWPKRGGGDPGPLDPPLDPLLQCNKDQLYLFDIANSHGRIGEQVRSDSENSVKF